MSFEYLLCLSFSSLGLRIIVLFFSVSFALGRGRGRREGSQNGERPGHENVLNQKDVSGSWCLRGWEFPSLGSRFLCLLAQRRHFHARRFRMWYSRLDPCESNRPKPIILSVRPVFLWQAQEAFPPQWQTMQSRNTGVAGELGSGEVWEMARRPLKGPGLHNPSLEPRVWKGQHRSRVTAAQAPPLAGDFWPDTQRSPMDQTKEDRKRGSILQVQSALHKRKGSLG